MIKPVYMKSILLVLAVVCSLSLSAQSHLAKAGSNQSNLPDWAQLMYSENPNFYEVVEKYQHYYTVNDFEKNIHTQYFNRWTSSLKKFVQPDGRIIYPTKEELESQTADILQHQASDRGSDIWHYEGPNHHVDGDGSLTAGFRHSNVYCHDRSATNTSLLYCGTESGGLYKTTDAGQNWNHVTKGLLVGWVSAVRCKPTNDQFVIMSANNDLWRSIDGGSNWEVIGQPGFVSQNISAWEIAYNPENNDIIYAATNNGFFRSTDSGNTWTEVLNNNCETIAIKPNDPSVVYTIQYEPSLDYSRFYKSTDYGATFQMMENGWFNSSLGNIQIDGGRLAVTEADPNRIYALLVGYENPGSSVITNGWVGTWVSYDAGETWSFPHNQIGTPYTDEHPNLMNFSADDGTYTQIHYNTTMAASQIDPDKVLIGGLNLWISNDACATYQGVGGYIGGIDYFHVDQQEIRIYKTGPTTEEIWIGNDGGILHSSDFMQSHDNLNRGIRAVNLWGYDQGWSEDIMVGGRYHNGNMAYHENYPSGEFIALGGGEAPTGYVNYNDENETFFSDIGGQVLPESLDQQATYQSLTLSPNESYWNNGSSRIMFDNTYFNIAWLGNENKLYRSTDGGSSYELAFEFGTNPDNDVLWIEQSYENNDYIYLHQAVGNASAMWRSVDHGTTWTAVNLPSTLRNMTFTLSGDDENTLWVSYYDGSNGQKVYKTSNGGTSWDNWTTPTLNGRSPWAIAHQYGTDGGVYLAMLNGLVYYRNNTMTDWESYSSGLPASSEPLRIVPFYKGEVIRLATWNLGVWEAPFYESSNMMADFAAQYESFFCPGNPVHFVDHSVVPDGATYSWTFPGAMPSSSEEKNPTVIYESEGTYDVTLTVTFNGNSETVTKTSYIQSQSGAEFPLSEDFESGNFPSSWQRVGNGSWSVTDDASAYGIGQNSIRFDNFYYDAQGARDEFWTGKLNQQASTLLTFDAAYAPYGGQYSDTLAVLVSYNCGSDWTTLWVRGGEELAVGNGTTNFYIPATNEWANYEITIPANQNSDEVIIAFQNRGHYGNAIYVDNINLETIISIDEQEEESTITLYPNPTSDFLQISGNSLKEGTCLIQIFDATGRLITSENMIIAGKRLEKRIETDQLSKGYYTLEITNGGDPIRQPFIKK